MMMEQMMPGCLGQRWMKLVSLIERWSWKLLAGWNTLVLKSAHVTWQWQVAAGLRPAPGDTLDALRYALP